jgi:hypothetical protein
LAVTGLCRKYRLTTVICRRVGDSDLEAIAWLILDNMKYVLKRSARGTDADLTIIPDVE